MSDVVVSEASGSVDGYSLHDSGWTRIGGLRSYQLVAIAAGVVVGVGVAAAGFVLSGLVAAVVVAVGGLRFRVAGVPLPALAVPVLSWLRPSARRGRDWQLDLYGVGIGWTKMVPPWLAGMEPVDVSWRDSAARLIWDRRAGELSAVFALSGTGFTEADTAGQAALLAQWEQLFAPLGESELVKRVMWQQWTPSWSSYGHDEWVAGARGGERFAASDDYDALVASAAPKMSDREVLLVVTTSVGKSRLAPRSGRSFREELGVQLLDVVAHHGQRVSETLVVGSPLGPGELVSALRQRLDPSPSRRDQVQSLASAAGRAAPSFGVMAADERFGAGIAVDGSVHRTHFVAGWPQRVLSTDWFESVLAGKPGLCRTVTVVFEPVSRETAERQENQRGTSTEADVATKGKHGFRLKAKERSAIGDIERRESALASGQSLELVAGFVTVTSGSWEALEADCREALVGAAPLDLWPMAGRFGQALTTALPLGRSVRSRSLT